MLGQAVGRGQIPEQKGKRTTYGDLFHRRTITQGQVLELGKSRVLLTHPGVTPPWAHTKLAGAEALSATSFRSEATTGRRICTGGWGEGDEVGI